MAEEKIVSAEMDPESETFKQMLAGIKPKDAPAEKVEKTVVKADVKPDPEPSSGKDTTVAKDKAEPDDESPEALKAKIKGLEMEVGRRKGQHDRVEKLETEIADLKKRQTEPVDDSPDARLKAAIAKLDSDGIIEKKVEWEEEQSDARIALRLSEKDGDVKGQQEATQRIVNARKVLKALEVGRITLDTSTRKAEISEKEFVSNLESEVGGLINNAYEHFPDIRNTDSALFKAGDAEFRKRPHLMKAMGPTMGELVSLAYAILRNPELVASKGTAKETTPAQTARKDLLHNLDEATSKAFLKGGGATGTKQTPVDYGQLVQTGTTGVADFEKLVSKVKGES
jgi:hypothetical protein